MSFREDKAAAIREGRSRGARTMACAVAGIAVLLALSLAGEASARSMLPGGASSEEPITVTADSAELDDPAGTIVYRGDVRMQQGPVEVTADLVTILLEDEEVIRITAEGDRARYQEIIDADGELLTALARTIIYKLREEEIELIGNAYLTQKQNEFSGGIIHYDMRAGRVTAEGESDEGIQMILQPPSRRD